MELNMIIFRHILSDSLMPWLQANSDHNMYTVLLQRWQHPDARGVNKLKRLLDVYKLLGIALHPDLKEELLQLSRIELTPNARKIGDMFETGTCSDTQYHFYHLLIREALTGGLSALELNISQAETETLKRYHIRQSLQIINDLLKMIDKKMSDHSANMAILCCLKVALRIFLIEAGIRWGRQYAPSTVNTGIGEMLDFSEECKSAGHEVRRLTERFIDTYTETNNTDTDKENNAQLPKKQTKRPDFTVRLDSITDSIDTLLSMLDPGNRLPSPEASNQDDRRSMEPVQAAGKVQKQPDIAKTGRLESPENNADHGRYLNRNEVCRMTGIGLTKLGEMSKNGEIPRIIIGKRYKYFENDIQNWLNADKVMPVEKKK